MPILFSVSRSTLVHLNIENRSDKYPEDLKYLLSAMFMICEWMIQVTDWSAWTGLEWETVSVPKIKFYDMTLLRGISFQFVRQNGI